MFRTAARLSLAALILAPTTVSAQRFSESYEFLKAVKEADGNKVTEFLNAPGQRIVDAKDRDTGDTALHIVARRSDATYLRFLLARNANPNVPDARGNSALMIAVSQSCSECVDALVKGQANVNLANGAGETPLIRAVQMRSVDIAQQLLAAGANPDQSDAVAGMSARDYAKRDGRSPAITKLLADAPKAGTRPVSGPKL